MRWPWSRPVEKPVEEPPKRELPDLWRGLDLDEKVKPTWPLIVANPLWTRELVPWFRALLLQSLHALSQTRDPEIIRDLQVRIALLEGLIRQPEIEVEKVKMLFHNQYGAGELPEPLRRAKNREGNDD